MKPFKFLALIKRSTVSKDAKIYPFTMIRDSRVDDFSYVSYNCMINNCSIGKFCSIATGAKIGLGIHPLNFISTSPLFYSKSNPLRQSLVEKSSFTQSKLTRIGNDVWIGANATILDGINVGDGAVIGANSVVTKDVEPYSIVGGVPAKKIKSRFSPKIIEMLMESAWWNMPLTFFQQQEVKSIFSSELTEPSLQRLLEEVSKNKKI